MSKHPHTSAGTAVAEAANNALEATSHALESTRKRVSEAAGKVGDTARDLRGGAVELGRAGAESVSDATVAGQRWLGKRARATRNYVEHAPLKSVLIAAAVAAVVASTVTAIAAARRDRG